MISKIFTLKDIALKLHFDFEREKEINKLFYFVSNLFERTKYILDLSDRTLKRWISNTDTVVKYCHRKGTAGWPSTVDSFKKDLIVKLSDRISSLLTHILPEENSWPGHESTTLWHTVRHAENRN